MIDSAPEVMLNAVDFDEDLIEMPLPPASLAACNLTSVYGSSLRTMFRTDQPRAGCFHGKRLSRARGAGLRRCGAIVETGRTSSPRVG